MGPGQLAPGAGRVPALTWRPVASVAQVLATLAEGTAARATAATSLNAHSSRSHALLSVRLSDPGGGAPPSVLHLVDLAGSERVARSEARGEQLKEAAVRRARAARGGRRRRRRPWYKAGARAYLMGGPWEESLRTFPHTCARTHTPYRPSTRA